MDTKRYYIQIEANKSTAIVVNRPLTLGEAYDYLEEQFGISAQRIGINAIEQTEGQLTIYYKGEVIIYRVIEANQHNVARSLWELISIN